MGFEVGAPEREPGAAGVMMIPIPRAGILSQVRGLDEAKCVANVEDVIITAHRTQELRPPPEGASYLGFIFSRAETADTVETSLRQAHSKLEFVIE
jgi:hypothetical protein